MPTGNKPRFVQVCGSVPGHDHTCSRCSPRPRRLQPRGDTLVSNAMGLRPEPRPDHWHQDGYPVKENGEQLVDPISSSQEGQSTASGLYRPMTKFNLAALSANGSMRQSRSSVLGCSNGILRPVAMGRNRSHPVPKALSQMVQRESDPGVAEQAHDWISGARRVQPQLLLGPAHR